MTSAIRSDDLCAIFVHAGAGYHSRENENKHLEVCALAAEAAMTFLKHGGNAVEAVEIAIMVLEDDPITNSGFGSNLTEGGLVECDASVMDHFGRSGAVGAVSTVKNPIQLARKVYEKAYRSPGMHRVPPNFLCGDGAADFAWKNNVIVVPHEMMIAPHANLRWKNWTTEIAAYERKHSRKKAAQGPVQGPKAPNRDWLRHTNAYVATRLQDLRQGNLPTRETDGEPTGSREDDANDMDSVLNDIPWSQSERADLSSTINHAAGDSEDAITDTVGAIAVDIHGNLAAGSSSGGIGMKHHGRVGPAALIGIGTHVIPVDPADPDQTSVAVVTSGTGEHIATTFAASTCAERIYYGQKRLPGGIFETVSEEEAIDSMIRNEFCRHPAVIHSEIPSSIGIMAVKRDVNGVTLYFAHNTESFVVGGLSNADYQSRSVMSRIPRPGAIAQGGFRIRRKPTAPKVNSV